MTRRGVFAAVSGMLGALKLPAIEKAAAIPTEHDLRLERWRVDHDAYPALTPIWERDAHRMIAHLNSKGYVISGAILTDADGSLYAFERTDQKTGKSYTFQSQVLSS